VSAIIDGVYCPLFWADPGHIIFQVPLETQAATLLARSAAGMSQEYPLTIEAAAPGIFLINGNQAAATASDGTLITQGNTAHPGSAIAVYLTGIGNVTSTPLDGDGAPLDPLATAISARDSFHRRRQCAGLVSRFDGGSWVLRRPIYWCRSCQPATIRW
jgi:uncharacterized protein (TIGR03437 family)